MPYSSPIGKDQILNWFKENKNHITKVLDIGAGSGTYPSLIKNSGDIFNIEWTGIEAWEPYILKYNLETLYNKLIIQDARTVDWNSIGLYDVAIAGDVLEHMSKEEAIILVNNILKISKTLIISIPIKYLPQDAYGGNPFEIHVKPDWSHDEVISTWGTFITDSYRKSAKGKIGVYWLKGNV